MSNIFDYDEVVWRLTISQMKRSKAGNFDYTDQVILDFKNPEEAANCAKYIVASGNQVDIEIKYIEEKVEF